MVYRSVRHQPPRGSTEWGARQFRRLLDDEERIAAERERLLAMGWRPPRAAAPRSGVQPFPEEPIFGDERDAYADLMQHDLALRHALDQEAKRRAGVAFADRPPASVSSKLPQEAPGWAGGGRFGAPVPASWALGRPDAGKSLYRQAGAKGDVAKAIAQLLAMLGMAEVARESADQDGGPTKSSEHNGTNREMLPAEPPPPPRDFDPEDARQTQQQIGPQVNIPPIIDSVPESIPIDRPVIPNILTGRDPSDPAQLPAWIENRGTPATQWDTTRYARRIVEMGNEENPDLVHRFGGYDSKGNPLKEQHYRNSEGKGLKWGNFVDATIISNRTGRRILLQTVDTNADWMTPSDREWRSNIRLMYNKHSGDYLVLVPKGVPAEQIDWEAFDQGVRPLVREIGRPWNADDISEGLNPDEGWIFIRTYRPFK